MLLNEDSEQCSTNSDCKERGGRFNATVCDTGRGVCVADISTGDSGTGGSAGDAAVQNCEKNSECDTGVCVDKQCVSTNSAECSKTWGLEVLSKDKLLLVGLITPTTGSANLVGKDVEAAVKLGREALTKEIIGGSVTAIPDVAVVRCDENLDIDAALAHLDKLGVRTVVGPTLDDNIGAALQSESSQEMMFVTPLANSPLLEKGANLEAVKAGRLFHVRPNRLRELVYTDEAVNKIFELLQAQDATKFATLNLAIVATADAATQEFVTQLKTVLPPASGVVYHDYDGVGDETAVAVAVVNQNANLVFFASDDNSYEAVVKAIETQPGNISPWYITQQKPQELRVQIQYPNNNVPARMYGIARKRPAISDATNALFAAEWNQKEQRSTSRRAEDAFDAFHVALYTWLGAKVIVQQEGGMPLEKTTSSLTDFFNPPGFDYGVSEYVEAASQLLVVAPGIMNFHGASGALDFDVAVGSPNEDAVIYCYSTTDKNYCDTGFVLDSKTGAVSGTQDSACTCP